MAINKLSFGGTGNAVNPLSTFGDDILKVGNSIQQQELNRLAAERADKDLALRQQAENRAENQYADAQKDKQGIQELYKQLVKPKQVANAATMWAQTDKTPDMFKAAAFTDEEMAAQGMQKDYSGEWKQSNMPVGPIPEALKASILQKQKMQEGIAAQALTPTEAQLETRSQQIERSLKDMSDKGIAIPTAAYQELDKARLADKVAQTEKEKQIDEQLKELRKSRDENIGKAAAGYDKVHSNGLSVGDDGSITVGNPQGVKAMQAAYTDKINKEKGYQDAVGSIDGAINKVAKDSKIDIKPEDATKIKTLATETINALVAGGVDSKVASELVNSGISAGNNNWFWNAKDAGFTKPTKEILEPLMLSGKNIQELEKQKAALSVGSTVPRGSMVYDVGIGLAKNDENEIAALKAQKALLQSSPEERQFTATKNRLDELLNPKVSSNSSSSSASGNDYVTTKNGKTSADIPTNLQREVDYVDSQFLIPHKVAKNGKEITVSYSDEDRAAIVSQVLSESKNNPAEVGDNGTAFGVFQWRKERADALRKFAGNPNIADIPLETQYKFFTTEMANKPATNRRYDSMLEEFQAIDGAKEKAEYLSKHYEVAKGRSTLDGEAKIRGELAAGLLNKYNDRQVELGNDVLSRRIAGGKEIHTEPLQDQLNIDVMRKEADKKEQEKVDSKYDVLLKKPIAKWTTADRKLALSPDSPLSEDIPRSTLFDYFGPQPRKLKRSVEEKDAKADWSANSRNVDGSFKQEEGLEHSNLDWIPAKAVAPLMDGVVKVIGKPKVAYDDLFKGFGNREAELASYETRAAARTAAEVRRKEAFKLADETAAKEAEEVAAKAAKEAEEVAIAQKTRKPSKKQEEKRAKKAEEDAAARKKEAEEKATREEAEAEKRGASYLATLDKKAKEAEIEKLYEQLDEIIAQGGKQNAQKKKELLQRLNTLQQK